MFLTLRRVPVHAATTSLKCEKRLFGSKGDIAVSTGAEGMRTKLTIPISGPRPSPKENCMPSCRKKERNNYTSMPAVAAQTSTYAKVSCLGHFLPLSLRSGRNLCSGVTLLPCSTVQWDQLVFLYGRLANGTRWGGLSGLHPLTESQQSQ